MKMGRQRGVGRPQRPYRKPSAARILRDMPDADWGQKSRICVVRGAARKKIGRMGGRFGTSLQCETPLNQSALDRVKPIP